jgi:hypothetical protein
MITCPQTGFPQGHDIRKGCHYYTQASGVLRSIIVTGLAPAMFLLPPVMFELAFQRIIYYTII